MHLDSLDRSSVIVASVVENSRITPERDPLDVRRLTLNVASAAGQLYADQTFGVQATGARGAAFRLYTVADVRPIPAGGGMDLGCFVRRCSGAVSNFLCDRAVGDQVRLHGPYDYRFRLPMDNRSNLVMSAVGCGIAPFRALVHKAYDVRVDWKGRVRLFYGPETGLETLYSNDPADVGQYFDRRTYRAIDALRTRRSIPGSHGAARGLAQNLAELWDLVRDPDTYVYRVGPARAVDALDAVMARVAGGADVWVAAKESLQARGHWAELLFD